MVPVVIYARYSSHAQTELSIEGQLRDCRAFCAVHDFQIVGEYIDRAISGRTDDRPDFQRMILDAQKQTFRHVVVWKLDRFARNRYDSAFYKSRLKKCGVKVISATEAISDDPEGIILEGLLEAMAEYYSANLAKHVKRGMRESVLKGNAVGSAPYGYRTENRKLVVNEHTAPVVRFIFEQYTAGIMPKEIASTLNARGERTSTGRVFSVNAIHQILSRERYTGVYSYGDTYVENYCPVIIERELFEQAQVRLAANKRAPAAKKAQEPYLLQGKVYCGHCGAPMVGESGRSKTGITYKYYSCRQKKKNHSCDKRNEKKHTLEQSVVEQTVKYILNEKHLQQISSRVMKAFRNNTAAQEIEVLQRRKASIDESIARIVDTIAMCPDAARRQLVQKLEQFNAQLRDIDERIEGLRNIIPLQADAESIAAWIRQFCDGDPEDPAFQEQIVDTFIRRIYVYDNNLLILYNVKENSVKLSDSVHCPHDPAFTEEFGFGCAEFTSSVQIRTPRLVSATTDAFAILFPRKKQP